MLSFDVLFSYFLFQHIVVQLLLAFSSGQYSWCLDTTFCEQNSQTLFMTKETVMVDSLPLPLHSLVLLTLSQPVSSAILSNNSIHIINEILETN